MQVDLNIILAVLGGCLSVATFFIGRTTAAQNKGEEVGVLVTDLKYIKESIGRIEGKLSSDVKVLSARIEQVAHDTNIKIEQLAHELEAEREVLAKTAEHADAAHRRLNRLDGGGHI